MTEILPVNSVSLEKAARLLREGELVAFPTETVYGLGADGFNTEAVKKIFKAKGRPGDNPLILHIHDFSEFKGIAKSMSDCARKLAELYMPGPLTIVVEAKSSVPEEVRAGLSTVAVRMPVNPDAQKLLKVFGGAIAAPSANLSGKPSPTTAQAVFEDMDGRIPLILDGGETDIGVESTVVDARGDFPVILRPGKISLEDLRKIFPETSVAGAFSDVPRAPGMKYRHYAPKAPMTVFLGNHKRVIEEILNRASELERAGHKVGIICFDEDLDFFRDYDAVSLGKINDRATHSHRLFSVLRAWDLKNPDLILSVGEEEKDLGRAFMNRLGKAASGNIINLGGDK